MNQSVADNEPLVTLMRLALKDPEIKTWLMGILGLDNFNRRSAINTLLDELMLQQAPSDLISAIEALLDDQVAQRASEIFGQRKSAEKD